MSKFGDDIRRIAGYQKLLDMLLAQNASGAEQAVKGSLYGGRAIAYKGASSAVSGTGGVTKPDKNGATDGDKTETDKNPGEDKVSGIDDVVDGSTQAGLADDISSLDNTDRDGWYDLDSLLQGAKDGLGKAPPPNDGYRINTLTGGKTASGRNMVVHIKEASTSLIPPDGVDPSNPTPDPSYVPGYYYSTSINLAGSGSNISATLGPIYDYILGYWPALGPTRNPAVNGGWATTPPTTDSVPKNLRIIDPTGTYFISVTLLACGLTVPGSVCPLSASTIPQAKWVDRNATQLAWVTAQTPSLIDVAVGKVGRFVPHPNDVNVPSQYQEGASILDLVTQAGTDVRIGPLEAGGWYLYSRDSGTGLPTGSVDSHTVYTINPDRTPGGYITPTQLSKSLPK